MTNLITREGLEGLRRELKQILEVDLPATIEAIETAMADGDLKENSALDSAKLERDKLLARQAEIEDILNNYQLIEENSNSPAKVVKLGGQARIQYLHDNSTFEVKIVGSSESNAIEGRISNESPLAQALLGKKEGDETSFKIRNKTFKVKVLEILS
jgi:transcription elongation factor GreA